jgi:hypothetical protein
MIDELTGWASGLPRPSSHQILLVNHPLLTKVDVDCLLQDQNSTMRLLQSLPQLQCFRLPRPKLLLPVLVERLRQRSALQMVQSLLQFPPTVPSFDVLPPLATVDDLQCSSVSGELVQLLQSVRLDS